ncbi:MAG: anti-sigma factor antagonist [Planctomycetota bacterium]|jgi:anti-anti-sigma factor
MDVSCALEYPSVPSGPARKLHALVRIETWPEEGGAGRKPLNVALVIDRSGSMAGEKLARTKEAALALIENLTPFDVLTIVSYGDTVEVHRPPGPVADKAAARDAVLDIRSYGDTNLSGGWLKGLSLLAQREGDDFIHRLLLLTDGRANRGVLEKEALVEIARQHNERALATTSIGFGSDFDEALLVDVARAGGGSFHYISKPDEASSAFLQEFGELSRVFGQNLEIGVKPAHGAAAPEIMTDLAVRDGGGHPVVALGDIRECDRKHVLLAFRVPEGVEPGEIELASVRVRYDAVRGKVGARQHVLSASLTVTAAGTELPPRDPEVEKEVALREIARAKREARERLEAGDAEGAKGRLRSAADLAHKTQYLDPSMFKREDASLTFVMDSLDIRGRMDEAKKQLASESYQFDSRRGSYERRPDVDVRTFTLTPENREAAMDVVEHLTSTMETFGHEHEAVSRAEYAARELLANALEHGCRDQVAPRVEVELRISRSYCKITVEDNGPGFDPEAVLAREAEEAADASHPRGRGLLSVKNAVDSLTFGPRGNRVSATLRRERFKIGTDKRVVVGSSGVGEIGIVSVEGSIDSQTYGMVEERLEEIVKGRGASRLAIDMSNSSYISSCGIGVLVKIQQDVQELGGRIVIVGAKSSVRDVLNLMGLDLLFSFADTMDEAMKLFGA